MKETNLKRVRTAWFQPYDILEKAKTMGTVKRLVVARGLGEVRNEHTEHTENFLGSEIIL